MSPRGRVHVLGQATEKTLTDILASMLLKATEATLQSLLARTPVRACTVTQYIVPSVAAGTSQLILPANSNRLGWIIWNNSGNSCYISFLATAVAANAAYIVPTFQSKESLGPLVHTGPISAIRNAGTGTWTAWEYTP